MPDSRSAELPTGTVTFLFSDIEGSTRLVQQLGDRYRRSSDGGRGEAIRRLRGVYEAFDEGFDAVDLVEARMVLQGAAASDPTPGA